MLLEIPMMFRADHKRRRVTQPLLQGIVDLGKSFEANQRMSSIAVISHEDRFRSEIPCQKKLHGSDQSYRQMEGEN